MKGSRKLKDFGYPVEVVKENLRFREETGKKKPIAESHEYYVNSLAIEGQVICKWIQSKENIADIMTKPLDWRSHHKLSKRILNSDKIKLDWNLIN